MSERLTVVVDDGISETLRSLAGGSRKQGAYLSKLIDAVARGNSAADASDVESLRMTLAGVIGAMRQLEARVAAVEQQRSVVIV